ncbi:MAG: glycosyltransferase [Chitinophagia bacterium]|jgi:glycosyltransferase involved in cell wall biosynthesis
MKISVIIPNYDDTRIERALLSVRNQDYKNIQIIVVHGGPLTFELQDIYKKYAVDNLINEPDNGIFDALNKGVRYVSGDVVYLLGSDDYLSDNTIFSSVYDKFQSNAALDGVCIGCIFVTSDGTIIRKWFPPRVTAKRIKIGLFPPHFSLFLKRDVYDLVGPFKSSVSSNIATDIMWLLDFAIKKPKFQINTLLQYHLNMEYGGASTRSFKIVWKQFKVVHRYAAANKENLPFWYFFSLVRTGSKLFQIRIWEFVMELLKIKKNNI